jgi:hypothetical protein
MYGQSLPEGRLDTPTTTSHERPPEINSQTQQPETRTQLNDLEITLAEPFG